MRSPARDLTKTAGRGHISAVQSRTMLSTETMPGQRVAKEVTTSRTTDLIIPDHEGILRTFGNGEVGIEGGRVVENLLSDSEDFNNWLLFSNGTGSNPTVTTNAAIAPDGSTTAEKIEIDVGAGETSSDYSYVYQQFQSVEDNDFGFSVYLKGESGGEELLIRHVGATDYTKITLSTEWQRFHVQENGFLTGTITLFLGVRQQQSGHGVLNASPVFYAWGAQMENVTGQSNQNPSEYVSSTIGKQVYATANGNTVASNVVTEATGASLSPAPAVYCEPAHTNLITYSHEFDNAAWSKINATVSADAVSAPDQSLAADKIVSSSSTETQAISESIAGSDATVANTLSIYFKAAEWEYLILRMGDSVLTNFVQATFRANGSGAVSSETNSGNGSGASGSIESIANGWYRAILTGTPDTSAGTIAVRAYASHGDTTSGAGDGSSGLYVWGAQVTESSSPLSYIPTSGATATANATEPVVTWPAGLVNDFVVKFDLWIDQLKTDAKFLAWDVNGSDYAQIYWSGTRVRFRRRISATNYDAASVGTPSLGAWHEIIVRLSSSQGAAIWVDGNKGSETSSNTLSLPSDGGIAIGNDFDNPNTLWAQVSRYRNLQIFKVSPNITDEQVLAL